MNKQELQELIISTIYDNTTEDISGNDLQGVLLQINNKLSEGTGFGGVVLHDSIIIPDQETFYIAGDAGYYTVFNITISNLDKIYIIEYTTPLGWHTVDIPVGNYQKPESGIPESDLDSSVQSILNQTEEINRNYLKAGESVGSGSIDFDPFVDTIHNIPQMLTSAQKQQARQNIGAQILLSDLPVSDGLNIELGQAYIDSVTGNVKVKLS